MNNLEHKQEIIKSRVGGFGSSDAKLFYKIGTKGLESLSQTDIRRIAVAKGLIPYTPIPSTPATIAGHLFEDYLSQPDIMSFASNKEREVLLTRQLANNFKVFSHVDFWDQNEQEAFEAKFSQYDTDKVFEDYFLQMQWHILMGASRCRLIHGWGGVDPFHVEGINQEHWCVVDRNIEAIFINGIGILDTAWNDIDLTLRDEISPSDLLPYDAEGVAMLTSHLSEIKRLEAEIADYKERLLLLFEDNNIKSLKSDKYTITYVAPSVRRTFDKKLLSEAHPEIILSNYEKESHVKSSLKITLK